MAKPRLVGINHVALEVGDLDEAIAFYRQIFDFEVKREDRFPGFAFIDIGDQFLALSEGRRQPADVDRHFGLVVDDKEAVHRALERNGIEVLPGPFLDFRDPWGNRVQIVEYGDIRFLKTKEVLRRMGLDDLAKSPDALRRSGRWA